MSAERLRVDKWLWYARVVKTRTLAQRLVESGHVRQNGTRLTVASQTVRIGDVLTIALDRQVRVLAIRALGERRGSAPIAAALYEDRSPPPPPRNIAPPPGLVRDQGTGRPTKRDRRKIDDMTGRD